MTPPRVFISYSHDSDAHRAAVLNLANRLRTDGVDAMLDQYVNGSPTQGWPRWMLDELDRATHVLCVCTSTYHRRFRGREQTGKGKGVTWEGTVITQELYDAGCQNRRFIPVLFGNVDISSIPEPLRSTTPYRIKKDYQGLYDAILGQAGVVPPPLGPLKVKDRSGANIKESTISDTFEDSTEVDRALFRAIRSMLPATGSIAFIRKNNFAGFSFRGESLKEIREFAHWAELPENEFLDPELEELRSKLFIHVKQFLVSICSKTFPTHNDGYFSVPADWEDTNPEAFNEAVDAIHGKASEVCLIYDLLIRTGRRRLNVL